ncbi:MAG: tRNA pseudouridine(13) synthase TruD [Candidatus Hodarchaeales archaeon]
MTNFSKQASINKQSLYETIGVLFYSTPWFKGTKGKIKQNKEDFVVHEILPNGEPILSGYEIGSDVGGMYVHCVLHKWGLDTFSAIKRISHDLRISEADFGYAGLKDASAETYQRISIWKVDVSRIMGFSCPGLELLNPIRQKFSIKLGDLLGNFFRIKFKDILYIPQDSEWRKFIDNIQSQGILNYYGLQRFGSTRPILHLIGRMILLEDYQGAIDVYLGTESQFEPEKITRLRNMYNNNNFKDLRKQFPNSYQIEKSLLKGLERGYSSKKTILSLPRPFLRLAISAYQSFICNKIISYIYKNKFSPIEALFTPLPGYDSKKEEFHPLVWEKMLSLLYDDRISLDDFRKTETFLRSKGSKRRTYFYVKDFSFQMNKSKKELTTMFSLPKGSYATIVCREISKN